MIELTLSMLVSILFFLPAIIFAGDGDMNEAAHQSMADRIIASLQVSEGERVMLRFDPETMPALESVLAKKLREKGAAVESVAYGSVDGFEQKLDQTDIYVWLPAGPRALTPRDQALALGQWLDAGKGRQVHFHWGDGTRATDGMNGRHSAAWDRVYFEALSIDYRALDKQMDAAIAKLRSGEVRVTTPSGTDLRFKVGDRPFCKQNGDASRERMKSARTRIDREIELPAGALRVAPIEKSVNGVMAIERARFGEVEVKNIRLEFREGIITRASASANEKELKKQLEANRSLNNFRELAIGFNPRLVAPAGEHFVPYYGYGAGAVRLGLGDNTELGGAVSGGAVRWLFFIDATVAAGRVVIVKGGRLVAAK